MLPLVLPKAEAWPGANVPALTVVPPLWVLAAVSVVVPEPALVKPPKPLTSPLNANASDRLS